MARTDQPHKLTFDAFVAKCVDPKDPRNAKHQTVSYDRAETRAAFNGSKSKVPLWCTVHEQFFVQQVANHMNGQGCPDCSGRVRSEKRRKADPLPDFFRVHGDRYDYSRVDYINSKTPITIVCREHGPFEQKPNAHLTGHGCPACWEVRRRAHGKARTIAFAETFADRAREVHDNRYEILTVPAYAHDTVALNCKAHGPFLQKAYSHLQGIGCPVCGRVVSQQQRDVAAFVGSLGVKVVQDEREMLGGLHIDIWLPEKRIGIEYNGSHWHTESRVKNKHRDKYERAKATGVRLIQVFDFEWLERPNAVRNRLTAILTSGAGIAARKCAVEQLSLSEAAAFLETHHTQGAGASRGISFGLRHEGCLVACATFAKSRYTTSAEWELLRYASNGRVQGGFTRLFSAFLRAHAPASVVSYADLRWGEGDVYAQAGFQDDGMTPPDYWYAQREKRISRYAAQHRPKGMTEREWAESMGYEKVLGVGHRRWIWSVTPKNP
jgi:hypothetical protein